MADAPRLTIIGLGLVGTSLGLAVRAAKLGYRVIGHDLSHDVAGQAKKRGALDQAEWNLPAAVERSDLVVIATPARAVEQVLRDIAPFVKPDCVVTDVAATKVRVLDWAEAILPENVHFVGGHPIAEPSGRLAEVGGVAGADSSLFRDVAWCVVPGARAPRQAIDRVTILAKAVGARPIFMEAAEHDGLVAGVSHLPIAIAAATMNALAASPGGTDLRRIAGAALREATGRAGGSPASQADVCLTSPESLLRWLDALRAELDALAASVRADDAGALADFFARAHAERERWFPTNPPEKPTKLFGRG